MPRVGSVYTSLRPLRTWSTERQPPISFAREVPAGGRMTRKSSRPISRSDLWSTAQARNAGIAKSGWLWMVEMARGRRRDGLVLPVRITSNQTASSARIGFGQADRAVAEPAFDGGCTVLVQHPGRVQYLPDGGHADAHAGQLIDLAGVDRGARGVLDAQQDPHAAQGGFANRFRPPIVVGLSSPASRSR